ncbi:unnamed protein product [Zymoseptoria tritici ST99CH_1E4]|uniref:DNA-directed RNA polymerase n=1 Tax=Zymoseptoria tritici ST99CH_1E4 TaxID=1276532 RepID=A0A2H1H9K1_ZYMTR|nr:unnamed protein product [Zymoseptoria tritici ST99CH_1E4]
MSKTGGHSIVVYVFANSLEMGDKVATGHGLKFTTGELIEDCDMPGIIDEATGKAFKPDILLNIENLGRGMGGQIRELSAATAMFSSIEAYRSAEAPRRTSTFTFEDQKDVRLVLPKGDLRVKGKQIVMTEKDGGKRVVRASDDIMNILHLRHMAAFKQHYASVDFGGATIPKDRMRPGTPRLGEGELASIIMQGPTATASVRDSIITSDLCYVTICPGCNRLVFNCDCNKLQTRPDAIEV